MRPWYYLAHVLVKNENESKEPVPDRAWLVYEDASGSKLIEDCGLWDDSEARARAEQKAFALNIQLEEKFGPQTG